MTLAPVLAALADATRRDVVERLARGEATVGALAAPYAMSLPAFTKHVSVLVDAGLVDRRKVGRTVVCTLRPQPLQEVATWVADVTSYWTGTLDRLERILTEEDA